MIREEFNAPSDCDHNWEPVSMVFETQLLDGYGRVQVRQPDMNEGRCYFICQLCACHTYMTTQWAGYRLYGSEDARRTPEGDLNDYAQHRKAWKLDN